MMRSDLHMETRLYSDLRMGMWMVDGGIEDVEDEVIWRD